MCFESFFIKRESTIPVMTLSWKRYDDEHNLSELLTDAARACVDALASHPGSFLASYFTKVTSGDHVEVINCEKCYTPQGDLGLSCTIRLFTNATSTTTAYFTSEVLDSEIKLGGAFAAGASTVPTGKLLGASDLTVAEGAEGTTLTQLNPMNGYVKFLLNYINDILLVELRPIGVCRQLEWDQKVISARIPTERDAGVAEGSMAMGRSKTSNGSSITPWKEPGLPTTMCYAFSLAASIVGAKSAKVSLYSHFGALHTQSRVPPLSTKQLVGRPVLEKIYSGRSDHFTLPRLVLPFFGRPDGSAVPPASGFLCFQTLYLLPCVSRTKQPHPVIEGEAISSPRISDTEDKPINPKGLWNESLLERLLLSYRLLKEKVGTSGVRDDGAVVYNSVENITDAVQFASEIVSAAGLQPGVDVSFGMRINCPTTRYNPETAAAAVSASGKPKRGAKESKVESIMYNLFSGDAEISGAQAAEYLRDQVAACNGLLVYLEDTHEIASISDLHRLSSRLGKTAMLSGLAMYTLPSTSTCSEAAEEFQKTVETSIASMWSNIIALPARRIGCVTQIMGLTKLIDQYQRSKMLVATNDDKDLKAFVELGIGIGAEFLLLGALSLPSVCDAVTHLIYCQNKLQQFRALKDQPTIASCISYTAELPPVSDEPIAEIKRKNEKKKKKPTGKH